MSRSSFVLAVTLFVVAGSLAFMTTFDRGSTAADTAETTPSKNKNFHSTSPDRQDVAQGREASTRGTGTSLALQKSATIHLDPSQKRQVDSILSRTRRETRKKLDHYARRYQLNSEQRREIFPFIVAHHDQAHPSMIVNGQPIPSISPGSSLDESVSSFLDSAQQDALAEDGADHDAWWEDVVGQLESDLDTAISNGEMVPAEEDESGSAIVGGTDSSVEGNSEASQHSGGNLFDLLGQ